MTTRQESLGIIIDGLLDRLKIEPFKSLLDTKEASSLLMEAKRLLAIQNGEGEPSVHLALDKVLSVISRALYTALNNGRLGLIELTQIINIIGTSKPIASEEKDN